MFYMLLIEILGKLDFYPNNMKKFYMFFICNWRSCTTIVQVIDKQKQLSQSSYECFNFLVITGCNY